VLTDRVAGVRYELLLLADALEHSSDPDPGGVTLIGELLTRGCSPLYDANVPVADLHATLARASAQLASGQPPDASPTRDARPAAQNHGGNQDRRPPQPRPPAQPVTPTTMESGRGFRQRWREHRTDRERRVLVKWLQHTANQTDELHPLARRREPLLSRRAAAVRGELLQIAAGLEHTQDPDPTTLAELHQLLANGCDSPLYNPDIHISELRATVYYLCVKLLTHNPDA
jgi:hypothetical protein